MTKNQGTPMLGDLVEHKYSKLVGTVTAICEYIDGSVSIRVTPSYEEYVAWVPDFWEDERNIKIVRAKGG